MENLTKQQIVLLTLLVSFMTSIATGIVTVSLMDQAPKSVSQTINRVVERTIERVITPATSTAKTTGTVKETIVVHDDDQLSASIDKNRSTLVRLYKISTDAEPSFVGLGIWITKDGQLITPNSFSVLAGEKIQALANDGDKYLLDKATSTDSSKILVFKVASDKSATTTPAYNFTSASFTSSEPKLGQSIASLSGEKRDVVFNGIISSLVPQVIKRQITVTEKTATSSAEVVKDETITDNYIETSLNTDNLYVGALLLNLSGEVIGLKLGEGSQFLPTSLIQRELSALK
jgi:hypothetical protein